MASNRYKWSIFQNFLDSEVTTTSIVSSCWSSASPACLSREVSVQAHTGVLSLCLWHSNTWLCPQFADCSVLRKLGFWRCPWWWWFWIGTLNYNLCFYHPIFLPSTQNPFLEVGGASVYYSWLMRIQRQCRWETGSVMYALGQVLTPSSVSGTGHLGTSNNTISHITHRWKPWFLSWKPEALTVWKCHQAEE